MHVERTTSGALRVTSPAVPGWAATARTPQQLARALHEGWTEAAVVAYAARKGQPYDVALHDQASHEAAHSRHITSLPADPDERETAISLLACSVSNRTVTSTGGRASKTTHDPLAWSELPDGRWVSPTGRKYRADSQAVEHVLSKRLAMGVGAPPSPTIEQLAAPSSADELWARRDRQTQARNAAMARHPAGKARPSA